MRVSFDYQSTKLSKLRLKKWVNDDRVSIYSLLMQANKTSKGGVNTFFQTLDLIFTNELRLIELICCLHGRYFMLALPESLYSLVASP